MECCFENNMPPNLIISPQQYTAVRHQFLILIEDDLFQKLSQFSTVAVKKTHVADAVS